jgi:hypothetical protein
MRRALGIILAVAALTLFGLGLARVANATEQAPHKSYVCKYVGTPGVDERLQTGQNPIFVDNHAIDEDPVVQGSYFTDKQGRSFVLVANTDKLDPEPSAEDCPSVDVSPTPTPTPTDSPTPTPTPTSTGHVKHDCKETRSCWTPTWSPSNGATPGEHPLASTGVDGRLVAGVAILALAGLGALWYARKLSS